MTIDATFWVAISFFIFIGGLIYLKVPQKINTSLTNQINEMKKELNEAEKLKIEAKNLLSNYENQIDKSKLARIAFSDEDHQLRLNTIIHPYVFLEIDSAFDKVLDQGNHEIFVVDAALIYESGADTHMDYVIVVTSQLKIRTERVMSRGGLTLDQFLQRLDLQWPDEDKIQIADFVIHNNGSEEQLENEAKTIYSNLN